MVRADTIDLQDHDAPTAADHHKHIEADSIAPHQAAQYQHVQEERRSEEETLAEAWNMAGQHGKNQDANGNGKAEGEAEKKVDGTDAANGEAEDGSDDEDDDDMMDRMSSSPSIGDGAFSRLSPTILTPIYEEESGTPQHAEYERATFNQSPVPTLDSSPFAEVPRHMPLRLGMPTSRYAVAPQPAAGSMMSPSIHTPESSPLITTAVFGKFYSASSQHHRLYGRYEFEAGSESGPGTGPENEPVSPLSDDRGSDDDGPDLEKDLAEFLEKCDQEGYGELGQLASKFRMSGNAFAQQHGGRTSRTEVRTDSTYPSARSEDFGSTSLVVDEYLLNPRLSLVPCDDE